MKDSANLNENYFVLKTIDFANDKMIYEIMPGKNGVY